MASFNRFKRCNVETEADASSRSDKAIGTLFAAVFTPVLQRRTKSGNNMNNPTPRNISELSQQNGGPLVSLYAPMERAGREVRQNRIRWKNLLKEANQQLLKMVSDEEAVEQILRPATEKLDDELFWQNQSDGLSLFIGNEVDPVCFQVSSTLPQRVAVADRFQLLPLLAAVQRENCFVLAASPKSLRLLRIDGEDVVDLEPDSLPDNLKDALNIDEYVSALQFHSTSSGGGRAPVYHGQGGSDPDIKKQDELLQYFHRLDGPLNQILASENSPLVFAGVDYLFPIFKRTYSYANLSDDNISGNPDDLAPEDFLAKATPLMENWKLKRQENLVAAFQEKAFTDWASDDVAEILEAAKLGQVETLLISAELCHAHHNIGRSEEDHANSGGCGTLDQIVSETLRNSGTAELVAHQAMPADVTLAAVFRSPVGMYIEN